MAGPRRQAAALTLYSTFFAVSFALLGYVGPRLADGAGLPAVYLGHAGYMLAGAALMAVLLPADRRGVMPPLTARGLWASHVQIYSSPREAAPALGFVCHTFTFVAFLTLMPQQFPDRPEQIVLATFMPLVSVGVALTLGVWGMGRISAVAMAQLGFAASLVFVALLWLVWGLAGATVLAAFGVAGALGLVRHHQRHTGSGLADRHGGGQRSGAVSCPVRGAGHRPARRAGAAADQRLIAPPAAAQSRIVPMLWAS